jgi:hypothetical protein
MSRAEGAIKRSIRAEALNKLAEEHPDDFHSLMVIGYAENGLEYVRPLTAAEKKAAKERAEFEAAKEQFEALVEKFPGLKGRAVAAVAVEDDAAEDVAANVRVIDPALSRATAAPI